MIWDFSNYSIVFHVVDSEGNNLLDSVVAGNILDNDINVTYREKVYNKTVEQPLYYVKPQATYVLPLALRLEPYIWEDPTVYLTFGEFAPDHFNSDLDEDGWHGETFTIDWGDGTQDEVKFDLYLTWKRFGKCEPTTHKAVWLNDELLSTESFIITIIK